jgi:hypothetical protein
MEVVRRCEGFVILIGFVLCYVVIGEVDVYLVIIVFAPKRYFKGVFAEVGLVHRLV